MLSKSLFATRSLLARSSTAKHVAPMMMMGVPRRSVSLLINDQGLEEDQKLIQKTAYDFADQELAPNAAEWDEKKHFPMDVYKKAAELGFAGIYVDEKYGGCGLGRLEATLIFEGLATGKPKSILINYRLRWLVCLYQHP